MRFLDWDVLLFPSGEGSEGAHIPVREFKIQCAVEAKDARTTDRSPLMNCFIPSLDVGTSFQISVHSWTDTRGLWPGAMEVQHPHPLWEVRIVVDGEIKTVAHLPADAQWPQIITLATHQDGLELEQHQPLRFPPFRPEVTNEQAWHPSDVQGRIRVELAAGYADERDGRFLKTVDVVSFAFQHAPLQLLEQAGIAWPSLQMYQYTLPRAVMPPAQLRYNMPPAAAVHPGPHMAHRKMPSTSSLQDAVSALPQQFAGAINPYPSHVGNYDTISRSTSAYSTISASAGPMNANGVSMPAMQQAVSKATSPRDQQYQFRLPSDQLAQIIHALGAPKQEPQGHQPAPDAMPPPPLPAHSSQFRSDITHYGNSHYNPVPPMQRNDFDQSALNAIDRRAASNSGYSDVSMHPNCVGFPQCITEGPNGCLIHSNAANNTMAAPAAEVRGKKEGSSPIKPRDFLSVALEAPATSSHPEPHPPPPSMTVAPKDVTMAPKDMTMAPKDMMTNPSPVREGMASSLLVSSSPADTTGKKRTRAALKALNINDGGSPQKGNANKPARKVSRASTSSTKSRASEKENDGDEFLLVHQPPRLENQEMLDG